MNDILEMAARGRNKARFTGAAHHIAAEIASRKNIWLGVPVVVLTSIVGTSIFASFSDAPPNKWWQIATGFTSLLAAVLPGCPADLFSVRGAGSDAFGRSS